jgi:hypothetical protein
MHGVDVVDEALHLPGDDLQCGLLVQYSRL